MPNSTVEVGLWDMELLRYCLGSLPSCSDETGQLAAFVFIIHSLRALKVCRHSHSPSCISLFRSRLLQGLFVEKPPSGHCRIGMDMSELELGAKRSDLDLEYAFVQDLTSRGSLIRKSQATF